MPRPIIPEDDVIVSLDTNVVRHAYETGREHDWVNDFAEMAKNGYHFCLTDIAAVELMNGLVSGAIPLDEWQCSVRSVQKFMSPILPVLPGKMQLFQMCGTYRNPLREKEAGVFNDNDEMAYSCAIWTLLKSAVSAKYLSKIKVRVGNRGSCKYICFPTPDRCDKELDVEKNKWRENMAAVCGSDENGIEIDHEVSSTPPMSQRLDMAIKYFKWYNQQCHDTETPRNPMAKKRRNDGLDYSLVFALALPSLLCTSDGFIKDLHGRDDSFQKNWCYTPTELATAWRNDQVVKPEWPSL